MTLRSYSPAEVLVEDGDPVGALVGPHISKSQKMPLELDS